MSITFDVCAVDKSFIVKTCGIENKYVKSFSAGDIISKTVNAPLEQACSVTDVFNGNNLAKISCMSFSEHRRLILSPDIVWMTIERGLATHITENAEELRSKFVDFDGKKTIQVRRDYFKKGGVNDWEGCFDEFSESIGEFIGDKKDLIVGNFSTTDKIARVCSEIVLMDAMSEYFNYEVTTMCGIPSVTLEGTVEDWELIRDKAAKLAEFNLEWWIDKLLPVLDEIVKSAKGNPSVDFWKSWYSEGGGSGGPYVTGHIVAFYPYLGSSNKKNTFSDHGVTLASFPAGFSEVPFIWNYNGTRYPMQFIGGQIGMHEAQGGAVKAALGWAVREAAVPLTKISKNNMKVGMDVVDQKGKPGKLVDVEFTEWGCEGEENYSCRIDSVKVKWDSGKEQTVEGYNASSILVKDLYEV